MPPTCSAATEAVGKGAGRKEGASEGKTIGVDDPGQAGDASPTSFATAGIATTTAVTSNSIGKCLGQERASSGLNAVLKRATGRVILHSSFAFYAVS